MSQRDLARLHIIQQVLDNKFKQVEAAESLELSVRQIRRIVQRVRLEGVQGIIHKLRGQPSCHRIAGKLRLRAIDLYRTHYRDFGPTFAAEKLFEINKIKISDETLRLWLITEGLWQKRRKDRKHRQWRERKHYFGQMIQMDGSHHPWFEDRGPVCVLMGYIDDATGKKYGRFYEYEGTLPAMDSLGRYIRRYGIPQSVYLDRHSTYKSNAKLTIEEQLNDEEALSQFERACRELGIKVIHANSPQAKGRVERSFRTDQDRLVKELRLRGIQTISQANEFLNEYWPKHNKRFSISALKKEDMHRPLESLTGLNIALSLKTDRVVRNDFTVTYNANLYQILSHKVGRWVSIQEYPDGRIHILEGKRRLEYKAIAKRPLVKQEVVIPTKHVDWTPPKEHPWRRSYKDIQVAA
jgi:hypothetical protein